MNKKLRTICAFACLIAFAFAFGLTFAQEANAEEDFCCQYSLPGCVLSYGTWYQGNCMCQPPSNPKNCFLWCGECS